MSERILRSGSSDEVALVYFVNKAKRNVDIVWHNFNGDMVTNRSLGPGQLVKVNTYKNHWWTFVDPLSGEKVYWYAQHASQACTGSKTDFSALTVGELQEKYNTSKSIRVGVIIHMPLCTLTKFSLLCVLNCLKNIEDVERLDLPVVLKEKLRSLNQNRERVYGKIKKVAEFQEVLS